MKVTTMLPMLTEKIKIEGIAWCEPISASRCRLRAALVRSPHAVNQQRSHFLCRCVCVGTTCLYSILKYARRLGT